MLDILLAFEDSQQLDPSLIATTIEALIEKQTLEAAEQLFAYMETRTDRLTRVRRLLSVARTKLNLRCRDWYRGAERVSSFSVY